MNNLVWQAYVVSVSARWASDSATQPPRAHTAL